jgi:hypothetical protein
MRDRLVGLPLKHFWPDAKPSGSPVVAAPGILDGMAFVIEPHVAGELGSETELDPRTHPPTVEELHYVFDSSESDDIVESFPVFLVSVRLAASIVSSKLTGARLAAAQCSLREPSDAVSPAYRWLQIVGRPDLDDFWLMPDHRLGVTQAALNVLRDHRLDYCDVTPVD